MKPFVLYTLGRLVLFAATFGVIWLIFGHWLEWSAVSALYTALIALAVSSIVALFALRGLRDDFAARVSVRADRAMAAFEARKAAEDAPAPAAGDTSATATDDTSAPATENPRDPTDPRPA